MTYQQGVNPLLDYAPWPPLALVSIVVFALFGFAGRHWDPNHDWQLLLTDGCAATWRESDDQAAQIRLDIARMRVNAEPWEVRLTRGLSLHRDATQVISFRARADRPRLCQVQTYLDHPPWPEAGLNETVSLTDKWQDFYFEFQAPSQSRYGKISFGVGGDETAIEIADFTTSTVPTHASSLSGAGP